MKLAIHNAKLLKTTARHLLIEDGVIREISSTKTIGDRTIDAKGAYLLPGLTDLNAQLGPDFNLSQMQSEAKALLKSGIMRFCLSPSSTVSLNDPDTIEHIQRNLKQKHTSEFIPLGGLTTDLKGLALNDYFALKKHCFGLSNGLNTIACDKILKNAYIYAQSNDLKVFIEAFDHNLGSKGTVHDGEISAVYGLHAISHTVETQAIAKHLLLIEETGIKAHFSGISSHKSLELIARAKQDDLAITCDVAISHLQLSDRDCMGFDTNCHVLPPLRSPRDKQALIEGVRSGIIDAITSGHRPLPSTAKRVPFALSIPGMATADVLFPLLHHLHEHQGIEMERLMYCLNEGPSQILGIEPIAISEGQNASLVLFDPAFEGVSTNNSFGNNSPFNKWMLAGKVLGTVTKTTDYF